MKKTKVISIRLSATAYEQLKELGFNYSEDIRKRIDKMLKKGKCPTCGRDLR